MASTHGNKSGLHHQQQLIENPFQSLSGAQLLREGKQEGAEKNIYVFLNISLVIRVVIRHLSWRCLLSRPKKIN